MARLKWVIFPMFSSHFSGYIVSIFLGKISIWEAKFASSANAPYLIHQPRPSFQ